LVSPYGYMSHVSPYGYIDLMTSYGYIEPTLQRSGKSMRTIHTTRAFGEEVRRLRSVRGWTQSELAHLAGLSRSFVSELESGKATVEFGRALRLLGALGAVLSVSTVSPDPAEEPAPGETDRVDLDELLRDLGAIDG
jgi:HTH-type transcriptional regulator / antitoxin HipB